MLAIDCATQACSVALFDSFELVDARHEVLGRGHAERLVPMIAELPDKGRADRIFVSLGPGSFTGVRIGIATARALGLAWQAETLGYPTLTLIAAMARKDDRSKPVTVCMAGGHGEWFVQDFDTQGWAENDPVSLTPEAAAERAVDAQGHRILAGNRAEDLRKLTGSDEKVVDILPDARFFPLMSSGQTHLAPTPIYGRPPDAKPQVQQ